MCVIMYNNGDGTLKNVSCAESYPYICFRRESKDEKITECGTVDPGKDSHNVLLVNSRCIVYYADAADYREGYVLRLST